MNNVWKSNLSRNLKIRFFRATIESVLLYGAETWTLTKTLQNRLNGAYTKLLRTALNISWKEHKTNAELYGDLQPITISLCQHRLRFIGHCWRSKDELIHKLLLWDPTQGKRSRGRPHFTYIDQLVQDTGIEREYLPAAMDDRDVWRSLVNVVRARSIR